MFPTVITVAQNKENKWFSDFVYRAIDEKYGRSLIRPIPVTDTDKLFHGCWRSAKVTLHTR